MSGSNSGWGSTQNILLKALQSCEEITELITDGAITRQEFDVIDPLMHEKARLLPMTQPLLGLNEMVFAIKYPPALRAFPHLQRNRGNVEKLRIVHNHVAYQYNNEAVAFDWRPVGDFYFDTLPQLEAELRQALEVCAKEAALQEQPAAAGAT